MEAGGRDMGSSGLKAVLETMEGSAKRGLTYVRAANFLLVLEVVLLLSVAASLAVYVLTGGAHWQFAAAGAAFAAAATASSRLQGRFYRKALKELDKLEMLTIMAAVSAGHVDQAKALLKEKIEELKSRQAPSN